MAGIKAVEGSTLQASGCFDPANQRTKHVIVVSTIALAALALFSYALLSHFTPHLLGHLAMSPHVIFASMALSGVAAVALPILHGIIPSSRLTVVPDNDPVVPDNDPVVPRLSPSSSTGSLTASETDESEEETDPIDELRSCDHMVLLQKPLSEIYDQLLKDPARVSEILFDRLSSIHEVPQATEVGSKPNNLTEFWRIDGGDLLARIQTPENEMLKAFFPFISGIQLGQAIKSQHVDKLEQSLFPVDISPPMLFTSQRFEVLPENIVSANNIQYFSASFLRCLSDEQLNALPWDLICQKPESLNKIFDVEDEESREWTESMLEGLTPTNLLRIRPYLNAAAIPTIQLNLHQFAFDPKSSDEQSEEITGFTLANLRAGIKEISNCVFDVKSDTPMTKVKQWTRLLLSTDQELLDKPLTEIHALLLEDQATVSQILCHRMRLIHKQETNVPPASTLGGPPPNNLTEFWRIDGGDLLARIQTPENEMLKAFFPLISGIQLGQAINSQYVDKLEEFLFPVDISPPMLFTYQRFRVLPKNVVNANNIHCFSNVFLHCLADPQLNDLPWMLICKNRDLNNIFLIDYNESRKWTKDMLKGLTEENFNIIKPYLDPETCKLRDEE